MSRTRYNPPLRCEEAAWSPRRKLAHVEARRAFLRTLQPRDLIRWNGRLRLVREVHDRFDRAGFHTSRLFSFAKVQCSRYPSPLALYSWSALFWGPVELVARNVQLKCNPLDAMLEAELSASRRSKKFRPWQLEQCDVVGMVP